MLRFQSRKTTVSPPAVVLADYSTATSLSFSDCMLKTVGSSYLGPRYFLIYFEISVPRHIRFAELRKRNKTITFHK